MMTPRRLFESLIPGSLVPGALIPVGFIALASSVHLSLPAQQQFPGGYVPADIEQVIRVSVLDDGSLISYDTTCCLYDAAGPNGAFGEEYKGPIHSSVSDDAMSFTFSTNACQTTAAVIASAAALQQRVHHHYTTSLGGGLAAVTKKASGEVAMDGTGTTSTISPDGLMVVFEHNSAHLAGLPITPGHSNQTTRIYLKSLVTNTLQLMTPDAPTPVGSSGSPRIGGSAGNYVIAYSSDAVGHLLNPAQTLATNQVFVATAANPTTPIWISQGVGGPASHATHPEVSPDGNFVAWRQGGKIWIRDSNAALAAVAVNSQAMSFRGPHSVSLNGQFVAYSAKPLGSTVPQQVYVWDGSTTTLISEVGGVPGNADSDYARITDDGMFITYLSHATNFDPTNADGVGVDVFLHNRLANTTSLLSPWTSGTCAPPDITGGLAHGKVWVVFPTNSPDAQMGYQQDNCFDYLGSYPTSSCAIKAGRTTNDIYDPCYDVYRVTVNL